MAEYIEREALLKHACMGMTRVSDTEWQKGYRGGVDDMAEYIREQPAADVVEVRHGKWVRGKATRKLVCSNCGTERPWQRYKSRYGSAQGYHNGGFPEYNPRVYDDMLRSGKRIYCVATDDNHNHGDKTTRYYDSFGGFTVIKAHKLEYRHITAALEKGHFYASQGPEIRALWYEDGYLHIESSEADRIDFSFGIRHAVSMKAEENGCITGASVKVPDYAVYVRATVWDKNGKPANTNAYFVDELER